MQDTPKRRYDFQGRVEERETLEGLQGPQGRSSNCLSFGRVYLAGGSQATSLLFLLLLVRNFHAATLRLLGQRYNLITKTRSYEA